MCEFDTVGFKWRASLAYLAIVVACVVTIVFIAEQVVK